MAHVQRSGENSISGRELQPKQNVPHQKAGEDLAASVNLGLPYVGVDTIRALLSGVHPRAPDFWQLANQSSFLMMYSPERSRLVASEGRSPKASFGLCDTSNPGICFAERLARS